MKVEEMNNKEEKNSWRTPNNNPNKLKFFKF